MQTPNHIIRRNKQWILVKPRYQYLPFYLLSTSSLAQPLHETVFASEYHGIASHSHKQAPPSFLGVKPYDAFPLYEDVPDTIFMDHLAMKSPILKT